MESQIVRRRVNMITAHLTAHDDISASATHLFPMVISFSVSTHSNVSRDGVTGSIELVAFASISYLCLKNYE